MENQVTNNANALRLFFLEDVFLVEDPTVKIQPLKAMEPVLQAVNEISALAENPDEVVSKMEMPVEIPSLATVKPVESPTVSPAAQQTAKPKDFKYLGGNQKSVLILVNDAAFEVSSEPGRELLRKIVKAIDLATPDFALLNYANHSGTSYIEFQEFFNPKIVLAFGVSASELNLALNWQNEIILHQNTQMIFAPNLHLLETDLNGKKSLWGNLKKL